MHDECKGFIPELVEGTAKVYEKVKSDCRAETIMIASRYKTIYLTSSILHPLHYPTMIVFATPNVMYLFACNAMSFRKRSPRLEDFWLFMKGVTSRDTWLFLITAVRITTVACWTALLESLSTFHSLSVQPA